MTGRALKTGSFLRAVPIAVIAIMIGSLTTCSGSSTDTRRDLSERFSFVLYDGLTDAVTVPILNKLEDHYDRILADLGIESISDTIIVRIWNNEEHYLQAQQNDIGMTFPGSTGYIYNNRDIRVLYGSHAAQTVLHEFCHTVSLRVNPSIGNNPRWLWEAVAVYEAGEFVDPQSLAYLVSGNFPTLSQMNTGFNDGNQVIYQVGYIVSDYIIQTYGRTKFIGLIASNGDLSVLGLTASQFESGWKQFVQNKYFN